MHVSIDDLVRSQFIVIQVWAREFCASACNEQFGRELIAERLSRVDFEFSGHAGVEKTKKIIT